MRHAVLARLIFKAILKLSVRGWKEFYLRAIRLLGLVCREPHAYWMCFSRSCSSHGTEKDLRGVKMALFHSLDVWSVLLFPLGSEGKEMQYGFYDSVDCLTVKVCLCSHLSHRIAASCREMTLLWHVFFLLHFKRTINTSLPRIWIQMVH